MGGIVAGVIKSFDRSKGQGFVSLDGHPDHIFFSDNLRNIAPSDLVVGLSVSFKTAPPKKAGLAPIARDVGMPVCTPDEPVDMSHVPAIVAATFAHVAQSRDSLVFEKSTFTLLRLLGVHNIFQFPPKGQAGKSDGFFKIQSLAVIYDCTLNERFLGGEWGDKTDQIANYVATLRRGYVELRHPFTMKSEFADAHKQVWIITRKKSGTFQDVDGIPIKQIDVADISHLIEKRLGSDSTYKEQQLADDLIALGSQPLGHFG